MKNLCETYDVVVVGAGHAGCEAALACARLGLNTICFTVSCESIAMMPCLIQDKNVIVLLNKSDMEQVVKPEDLKNLNKFSMVSISAGWIYPH